MSDTPAEIVPVPALNDFSLSFALCDFAQVMEGKLYVMGAGWNMRSTQPIPFAVAGIIKVPWSATNEPHKLQLALVTGAGRPFLTPSPPTGDELPLVVEVNFKVGRPSFAVTGMPFNVPFAVNFGPMQFPPDQYEWRARIDETVRDEWRFPFSVSANWPPT